MAYWRAPDLDVCYVCGEDNHYGQFCPYNYIYGLYDQDTCTAHCLPGQRTITSVARRKFLRCLIRVNNMPPSFRKCVTLGGSSSRSDRCWCGMFRWSVLKSAGDLALWSSRNVRMERGPSTSSMAIMQVTVNCELTGLILVPSRTKLFHPPESCISHGFACVEQILLKSDDCYLTISSSTSAGPSRFRCLER